MSGQQILRRAGTADDRSVRGRGGQRGPARRADRAGQARRGRGPRVRLVPGRRRAGQRAGCHRHRDPGRRPGRLPAVHRARSRRPGPVHGDARAAAARAGRPGAPVRGASAQRGRARGADRRGGWLPGRRADQRGGRDRRGLPGRPAGAGPGPSQPHRPVPARRAGRAAGGIPVPVHRPHRPVLGRGCGRWPGRPIPAWPRGCTRPCPARTTRRPRRSGCSPPWARTWSACPPCWRRSSYRRSTGRRAHPRLRPSPMAMSTVTQDSGGCPARCRSRRSPNLNVISDAERHRHQRSCLAVVRRELFSVGLARSLSWLGVSLSQR